MSTSFRTNIEKDTIQNNKFRKILYTGTMQLVVMTLKPGEHIGMETHSSTEQFIRVEKGSGHGIIGGKRRTLTDGVVVIIPKGVKHDIIAGKKGLKLYTLYSKPEH